jgi:hypothetical protein
LYPEVRDVGSLSGVFNLDQFLVIGIEGQKDTAGTAVVASPKLIRDPSEADTFFGPNSSLAKLTKFVLSRGINFVYAVASASNATPTLVQRQTAWTTLEENPDVRIRLTDSVSQSDLAALADSCEWAEGIQNKQFCVVGLNTPTTSANLTTAAGAIASKRGVIVGPGVFDTNGTLLNGVYAAAFVAAEVAKNADIADDLDTMPIIGTTGIEVDTAGMPLFRQRAGAGTPSNDFDTLLNGGVSPLRQGRDGQAEIVHLRTTFTTDTTYDALMTLLIKDQAFIGIRDALVRPPQGGVSFLRRGNTPDNRALAAKIVDGWLRNHADWISPKLLPDGTTGYGVTCTASPDKKRIIITYQGEVVRNTQKIDINGVLTIPL